MTSSAIHGNKSQGARTRALADFKSGAVRVLVATDIAARGLDIDQLPHVVNFELPNVAEDYVHRIGRTARAGHTGEATSLVCGEEFDFLRDIEKLVNLNIEKIAIDGFTSDNIVRLAPVTRESLGKKQSQSRRGKPKQSANAVKPKGEGRKSNGRKQRKPTVAGKQGSAASKRSRRRKAA